MVCPVSRRFIRVINHCIVPIITRCKIVKQQKHVIFKGISNNSASVIQVYQMYNVVLSEIIALDWY